MVTVVACSLLGGSTALAQSSFLLGMSRSEFDGQVAASNSMGSVGGGFDVAFAYTARRFIAMGAGFGVLIHKDERAQSVSTTGGGRTTGANIYNLSAHAGLQTPRLQLGPSSRFSAALVGGRTFIDGSASVPNCANCPTRDLDLDGGFFVEPSVGVIFNKLGIGLGYRSFLGGDIGSVVSLRLFADIEKRRR